MEELLDLPPRRSEIDQALADVYSRIDREFNSPAAREVRAERYSAACADLLRGLEKLRTLAAESAELASKPNQNRDRILKRLGDVNRIILESEVKDVAGFLFPPISELEARLKTPGSDAYGRYLELSTKLYRSLAEAAQYHLAIFKKKDDAPGRQG